MVSVEGQVKLGVTDSQIHYVLLVVPSVRSKISGLLHSLELRGKMWKFVLKATGVRGSPVYICLLLVVVLLLS